MNRYIFLILFPVTIFIFEDAFSQLNNEKKTEIQLGYGLATTNEILNMFDQIVTTAFGTVDQVNEKYAGAGFFTINRKLNKAASIGLTFGVDYEKGDYRKNNQIIGNYKLYYYTIAGEYKYKYRVYKNSEFYGMAGFGYTFGKDENNFDSSTVVIESTSYNHLIYQFTPLGIRYGQSVAAFVEFGFGYKGIVNAGLSLKL